MTVAMWNHCEDAMEVYMYLLDRLKGELGESLCIDSSPIYIAAAELAHAALVKSISAGVEVPSAKLIARRKKRG